ncbi:MAG TPA: hypothetical protein VHC97_13055 [Thermoanaerobaculia bacterium]|jgi:hypothetical protein|nr:hypothetical protein [Thermoanaerobaculia bacterium]
MPKQASRRTFLTLAGASAGLLATNVRGALALEHGGPGPAAERTQVATIVGLAGAELEVKVEGSGLTYTLKPQDFGDWTHRIGDRVVVVEDPSGRRSVKPYVTTVNAPLPDRPSKVEIGSVIEVGQYSARISSESVKRAYEAIQARSPRAVVHWLLIENVRDGQFRVFGVVDHK